MYVYMCVCNVYNKGYIDASGHIQRSEGNFYKICFLFPHVYSFRGLNSDPQA